MSFKYYDIPIFALEDETEVEYILKQVSCRFKNSSKEIVSMLL